MSTRNAALVIALLIVAALGVSLAMYSGLPALVPIHWGITGQADGWAPKAQAIIMILGGMVLVGAMLVALPWLSPQKFSIETFRGTFNYVMALLAGLFFAIHVVSLQAALHPGLDSGRILISVLFVFLALIGNVMGKVRRNFYMGWRTPWTLASDKVWIATHRLAARLMFGAGALGAIAVWLGVPAAACFVLLLVAALAPCVYSLVLYKRLEREGRAPDSPTS